mgnify:CR=1 FL=1
MADTSSKVFMFPESNSSSIDPALLMALNNNGGFGGNGNWLWVIFLFFLYPMLRNGGLFGNNSFGNSTGGYLANMANNDVGREMLMSAIQGNGTAISNLATSLGCSVDAIQTAINGVMNSVNQVGNQVGMTGLQTINAVQAGNATLGQ